MIDLLAEAMAKESSGFLVDGFPATIEQVWNSHILLGQAILKFFPSQVLHQDCVCFIWTLMQAQLFEKTVGSPVKIIVFEMKDDLMRVRLDSIFLKSESQWEEQTMSRWGWRVGATLTTRRRRLRRGLTTTMREPSPLYKPTQSLYKQEQGPVGWT